MKEIQVSVSCMTFSFARYLSTIYSRRISDFQFSKNAFYFLSTQARLTGHTSVLFRLFVYFFNHTKHQAWVSAIAPLERSLS